MTYLFFSNSAEKEKTTSASQESLENVIRERDQVSFYLFNACYKHYFKFYDYGSEFFSCFTISW